MKKTVLNRNYSLLVLVLLILYVTYINIPDNLSMSGGGADDAALDLKLQKYSVLYKYLSKFFWVYVILVGSLLGYTIYRAFTSDEMFFQGVPLLGYESNFDWDRQGSIFLPAFFNLAKLKYGLFTPGLEPSDPVVAKSFEDDAAVHINDPKNRLAVDVFCNEIVPCNICHCQGPDPNYAGLPSKAPLIYYPGDKNNQCHPPSVAEKFINVVEYLDDPNTPNPGAAIINHQQMTGISDKHVGMIPNCCCELVHLHIKNTPLNNTPSSTAASREINAANISGLTADFIKRSKQAYKNARLMSAEVANDDGLVGLGSHANCETATKSIQLGQANDDGTPKLDDDGKPEYQEYKLNMSADGKDNTAIDTQIRSCNNSAEQIAKIVKTCNKYDPDMARGISPFHAQNLFKFYSKNMISNSEKTDIKKASSVNDVPEDWTIQPNPNSSGGKVINNIPANDWPGTSGGSPDPDNIFGRDIVSPVKTKYWYTTGSGSTKPNTKIELKIDTHLYEIYGKPVTNLTPISTSNITNKGIIDWLDSYIFQDTTDISNGVYMFPPYNGKRTMPT